MIIELTAILFIIGVTIISYSLYNSNEGRKSVYKAWYAGLLDFCAFLSGLYIVIVTFILYHKGISALILFPLFIAGSLQGSMHIAKWYVREKL